MLTLNQEIAIIKTAKESQAQLSDGTFFFGQPPEFGADSTLNYPFTGCWVGEPVINDKILTTPFTIYFLDLVHKDNGNEQEVLSDMLGAGLDIYSLVKKTLEDNYSATLNLAAGLKAIVEEGQNAKRPNGTSPTVPNDTPQAAWGRAATTTFGGR